LADSLTEGWQLAEAALVDGKGLDALARLREASHAV
jgi:hypothetical protein